MPGGEELSKLLGILSICHNLLFIIIAWLNSTNGFHFLKPIDKYRDRESVKSENRKLEI